MSSVTDRFTGRTVIVTGAGSGIGYETAVRIAREGGRVVASDVDEEALKGLVARHEGLEIATAAGDVCDEEVVQQIVALAGPQVWGLVNNAGIMDGFLPAHEVDDETWRRVLDVNVTSVLRVTRAVLPAMMSEGDGSIVNVASEAALRGSTAGVAYSASKHAVVGITENCAFMYRPHGIRVNAVAPGSVATGIKAPMRSEFASGRVMPLREHVMSYRAQPETLAAAITWLLSGDASNVSGVVLPVDGGWSVL
ncbi:SDR family NAD(P)-dependent oxidoreductase [Streptomyces sp. WG-D5]